MYFCKHSWGRQLVVAVVVVVVVGVVVVVVVVIIIMIAAAAAVVVAVVAVQFLSVSYYYHEQWSSHCSSYRTWSSQCYSYHFRIHNMLAFTVVESASNLQEPPKKDLRPFFFPPAERGSPTCVAAALPVRQKRRVP